MKERQYLKINEQLSVTEFKQIKNFVLEKGSRGFFRNIDSNNPCYKVKDFTVYLGPSNRRNTQCNPTLSDYNEMIIYDSGKEIQYYHVKIVRTGDKKDPDIIVPEGLEENNVYLINIYGKGSGAFKNNFFEKYLPEIKQLIQ